MRPVNVFALLLMLGVLLALCSPAHCQEAGLTSALTGNKIPLSLRLRDLTPEWRQFAVASTPADDRIGELYAADLLSRAAGPLTDWVIWHPARYYTKGETVSGGSETYLVAYRRVSNRDPQPTPLGPDTPLALCLLNLRTVGSFTDIQPFGADQLAASEAAVQTNLMEQSNSNLKTMALGLLQYVQDYDERLPPMDSAAVARKAIYPYVKNEAMFVQPGTNLPYQPNTSLSHRSLASFSDPATMVVYFEAAPAADGTRGVCFLDGHVKRFPEAAWPGLKRASHIPGPD